MNWRTWCYELTDYWAKEIVGGRLNCQVQEWRDMGSRKQLVGWGKMTNRKRNKKEKLSPDMRCWIPEVSFSSAGDKLLHSLPRVCGLATFIASRFLPIGKPALWCIVELQLRTALQLRWVYYSNRLKTCFACVLPLYATLKKTSSWTLSLLLEKKLIKDFVLGLSIKSCVAKIVCMSIIIRSAI